MAPARRAFSWIHPAIAEGCRRWRGTGSSNSSPSSGESVSLPHIPEPEGINHPLFAQVRALIDKGKTWVKLPGAYADTKVGPPTYADSIAIAQAYAKAAPERCVWGSDWPHPGEREKKPDDALLFDLILVWAPDEKVRRLIVVDNPAVLYDYPKSA
jgi:D-galactarolactone isomerase